MNKEQENIYLEELTELTLARLHKAIYGLLERTLHDRDDFGGDENRIFAIINSAVVSAVFAEKGYPKHLISKDK